MTVVQFVFSLFSPHLAFKDVDVKNSQADITKGALDYVQFCKPHIGKSKTGLDKAGQYTHQPGEVPFFGHGCKAQGHGCPFR